MKKKCPSNKITYPNRVVAWQYALFYYKTYLHFQYVYRCHFCKKYHTSTKGHSEIGSPAPIPAEIMKSFERVGKKWDAHIIHEREKKRRKAYNEAKERVYKPSRVEYLILKIRNRIGL